MQEPRFKASRQLSYAKLLVAASVTSSLAGRPRVIGQSEPQAP